MRHGRKVNHLGRTSSHRQALLKNMSVSLILHKRITTTVAKAKALRQYVEPLLNRAKEDTTHSRRVVFDYLQSKEAVQVLFDEVAQKITGRNGGYTRIIRLAPRQGDNAEMCLIELVDYNTFLGAEKKEKAKTRRGRRKKGGSTAETTVETAAENNATAESNEPTAEA